MRHCMEAKMEELVVTLTQLVALLASDGEQHWRAWILGAILSLEDADYSGVERLLLAYGGMGSFNDYVAAQHFEGGLFAWKPGAAALNDKIDALRSKAWQLASDMKWANESQRN